jgi:hypothetical protein
MNSHQNAGTTPYSRGVLVERVLKQGRPRQEVAGGLGISVRSVGPKGRPAWASSVEVERKVLRVEANHTVSSYVQGGTRSTHLFTSLHVLGFLNHAMGMSDRPRLGEIPIHTWSDMLGCTIARLGVRRDLGVIGIRRAHGTLGFNAGANAVLIGRDSPEQIETLRQMV